MSKIFSFGDFIKRLDGKGLLVSVNGECRDEITFVCADSKKAVPGTLFICKGNHFRPEYLGDAVSRGAVCCVSEKQYSDGVPCAIVSDVRAALAEISDMYYGTPCDQLDMIGVTGTKGKTTVVHFIKALLDAHASKRGETPCGLISTVETFDGVNAEESVNSTPESIDLQRILRSCVENGLHKVVCEVSSQALKYHRVRCVRFGTGVFTNIGEDHISPVEHPDFEDYFSSKLSLFSHCDTAVICRDSEYYDRIREAASVCRSVLTFGADPSCDVYVYDIRKENGRIRFGMRTPAYDGEFSLRIAGSFNVYNAAAAVAATLSAGIDEETVREVLAEVAVSGRMETYASDDGSVVAIVDYAHNAMSFETLFSHVLGEYPGYRIVSVFGSVGNKAEVRRYALGRIAGKYSDFVYITSEHPDYESPYAIAEQIAAGIREGKAEYTVIPDRELAVETAVREAKDRTVVLILGVGNETTQRINGVLYERRSDSECALHALKERSKVSV
ncbi:MAG: UDP-N-acetylmuramoyl-L-alanyl-D-glutamate--2,6-diaminopimelate ligase [Clostridia bacterium]|nr:UDP-N-acetylmuramoyl-L-alanyl-D-glutamate--2,6-diaminopimelate ligase [Clostridia bacterium]